MGEKAGWSRVLALGLNGLNVHPSSTLPNCPLLVTVPPTVKGENFGCSEDLTSPSQHSTQRLACGKTQWTNAVTCLISPCDDTSQNCDTPTGQGLGLASHLTHQGPHTSRHKGSASDCTTLHPNRC